ncbi:MAG: VWA domain-containing protein [Planctomycetaceae bacterium]|nr:VWA domain-containing protein [Planctomycetaceae bacterium]
MSSLDRFRLWWQEYTGEEETPFDGDTPAWAVSLVLHVTVLLAMALIGLPVAPAKPRPIAIVATEPVETEVLLDPPQELTVSVEPQPEAGAQSDDALEVAQALAPTIAEESIVPEAVEDSPTAEVDVELADVIPTGLQLDSDIAVKGDVGVGTTGASGAVDRLTVEIAASLEQRPTLICWVFDQSVSLAAQRKEIAARLDRVFDELGMNKSQANRPDLLNLVFAYGKGMQQVIEKPTSDADAVVAAIENIAVDDSGVEMTFAAIRAAAERAKLLRIGPPRRHVMIVAFTDEVGNDPQLADQTAQVCRTQGIPVYVVGVPAPFGLPQVKMKFVEFDPQYDGGEQWAVVDQGPETLYPEFVRIHPREAEEPIDSGFGPFYLSKLCAETGGIYFAVHPNRGARGRVSDAEVAPMASRLRRFFAPDALKAYRPDYVAAVKIDQMIVANKAKKALVEAARSSQISPMDAPTTTFPRVDDGALALLLAEAQKGAAKIQPKIDALYGTLAAGAADRDAIKEKRWQAGYDLSMGRVLAVKIRTDAYNIMLAQAKTGMKFKNPKNDTWVLEPSDDVSATGSQTDKLAKQCRTYLERVVKDHPGTPWAFLAGEELKTPLGYAWTETYTGVNKPQMGNGGGGGGGNPADDQARARLAPPKPKRPLKNL